MNGIQLSFDENLSKKENSYPAYEDANFYTLLNNVEI